jgi:hypothetical protein
MLFQCSSTRNFPLSEIYSAQKEAHHALNKARQIGRSTSPQIRLALSVSRRSRASQEKRLAGGETRRVAVRSRDTGKWAAEIRS